MREKAAFKISVLRFVIVEKQFVPISFVRMKNIQFNVCHLHDHHIPVFMIIYNGI